MLREAVAACRARGIRRLILEPGLWHLHPEKADGAFRHVTNHDPLYRRIGIWLDGFRDFELDGQGATLLCHGVITPIAVDCSRNITLRNLVIDWEKPLHLEGTVTAVGGDFFEVEMLPECEAELRNGILLGGMGAGGVEKLDPKEARQDFQWNYWVDPVTKAASAVQPTLKLWNPRTRGFAEVTELATNRFRIRNAHADVLPLPGAVMVCKGTHRPNRLAPAIHLASVDGVRVEDVAIHHAGGMGLIAEDCADPTVRNLKVMLRPGSRRLITTTADATHFMGCRGTVRVEGCLFENMLDDGCNVHGVYAIAEEMLAPNRLAVSFSHFQQLGTVFARLGDRIRLLKRDTLLGYAECRVIAVTRHNEDYYVLTLNRPLANNEFQPNSSVENLTARPDVVIRNNTVRNNRARSVLVTTAGKVTIEHNRFERPSMMSVLIEGDNHYWYESGAVEDVTIRSNTFVGLHPAAPLFKVSPMQPGEKRMLPPYHRNVRILDNTIEAAAPLIVEANRVGGLVFSRNTVRLTVPTRAAPPLAMRLNSCADVSICNNRFDQSALVQAGVDGTGVTLAGNENLTLQ